MEFVRTLLSTLASSMFEQVVQQLSTSLQTNIGLVSEVDKNLSELQATYMKTQAMLDELDCWQINNTTMEPWLQNLVRCCYDTEDLVDDLILSLQIKQQDEKPVPLSLCCKIFISGRWTIPGQIAELQKNLEVIRSQIESILSERPINSTHPPNSKNPLLDRTPIVVGTSRDNDKETIILELTSLQRNPSGVSIVGMDGLGKTVLARTIQDDKKITNHFQLVLSAHVSGDFQMEDIVQKLAADHSRKTSQHSNSQPSEPHQNDLMLQGILCSRRSLIILDDLWSVTDEDWEYFRCNYLNSSPYWKILTTTRNPKVAEATETTSFYLNRMTDEDCKKLIIHSAKQSVFESEIWSDDIEFIAKKCNGMPIIANKLGLKLSKKKREDELKATVIEFKMNELWKMKEFREVFPSLNLNVPKLPPDLKRCFAYCSLFSPDHEFNKDDLMQLWEVEGFIEPQQTNRCFDDLLSRSILHPYESRSKRQGIYKMHEFNHEFAHLLSSKAVCRVGEGTSNLLSSSDNIRHLSLTCQNIDEPLLKKIEQCKGLRTFLLLHQNRPITRTLSRNFFHKLQSLRLLDLSHTNITSLPKSMSPSVRLRYLDLSYTEVKRLPEPINILRALRILKLKNCSRLRQLPKDLNQLISLKHLHVNMRYLGCPPSNLGKLTNLQTLNSFLVANGEGFKVTELKNMAHLKEVHISGLENIRDMEEAQEAMLSQKSSLRTLVLEWDRSVENAGAVLEGLQPHNHLQDLVVKYYCGQMFPPWLTSPSCQLVSVCLDNCQNCQVLPSFGQLLILKTVVIRSIHNVEIVDNHFYGQGQRVFPCLELLEFCDMKGLRSWTGLEAGSMPCLRALKIVDCPKLVNLPSLENLSCLLSVEITDCPMLQSLPELPLSLNGELGEHNALIKERCQTEGAHWRKFKGIPYVKIDATRALTKSSIQPPDSDQDKVPTNEHQPSTSTKLFNENSVPQDPGTLSEDQPASPQLQPTTTCQMACKNCNLQDEMQRNKGHPPELIEGHDLQHEGPRSKGESQDMSDVMPASLDEFSEKEHHSHVQRSLADEICTSQHEGPRSKRKFQDMSAEITHSLEARKLTLEGGK